MSEHTFDTPPFDYSAVLDGLRCRPIDWLRERRSLLVREQRRLRVEELAVTKVLDERGQADVAGDGVSERTARETVELARALESRPAIAAAAYRGELSAEQLQPVVRVADASNDEEWARRAPNCAPADLARMARSRREVTNEEAAARREARDWRMWWRPDSGMLSVRGEFPDMDGALVESVFGHMIERMRPAKCQSWDTYGHRGADAMVELCRSYADVDPTYKTKPRVVVQVPVTGSAEVNGTPIARSTLEAILGDAIVESVIMEEGEPLVYGPGRMTLPARLDRAIHLRDLHCRWPGCERTRGLQVHHLVPVSHGGHTEPGNLACVCTSHHQRLEPHGPYRLTGNPNQPDGLHLDHRIESSRDAAAMAEARAGPAP